MLVTKACHGNLRFVVLVLSRVACCGSSTASPPCGHMLKILTPLLDDKLCIASSLTLLTSNCLLITSWSLTFSASAVVLLEPSALFVVKLWNFSRQPPSQLASTAASLLHSSGLLQRSGTVELFAAPVVFCFCSSSDFSERYAPCLSSPHSSVQLWHICWVDATSYRFDSLESVSARTWFSLSSHPSPWTPGLSWSCACLYSSRSSRTRACCSVFDSPISCFSAASDFFFISLTLWDSLSCRWCFWCFWENIPAQSSELRCVPQLLSALQLPSLSRSRVSLLTSLDCESARWVENAVMLVRLVLVWGLSCFLDLFLILDWRKKRLSWSCLMSCITSLCTLPCWYPSRAADSSLFTSCWIPLESLW